MKTGDTLVPPGSDSPCDDDTITRTLETFFLNEKIYGWEISRELLAALIVEDINSLQLKMYCCFEEDLLELIHNRYLSHQVDVF